jgi:Tfp pilus assembly protein PilV
VTLLEGVVSVCILVLAATGILGATIASSRVAAQPSTRDQVLVAARNAAVEARAVAAYDANAAAAILAAPAASWTSGGVTLQSSTDGQTLVLVATMGSQSASVRYPVSREALPQGAIVDQSGTILVP